MKFSVLIVGAVSLFVAVGCKPRGKDISPLARKEAANLVSEAEFATTMRDYARAEPLYAKAVKLCPDVAEYWLALGADRCRLGDRSGAKSAYNEALSVYRDTYAREDSRTDARLREVYVLALLGRGPDAQKALEKAQKKFPSDRAVRSFIETRQLEQIQSDPSFKEIALQG